jgi:hypothetical protein
LKECRFREFWSVWKSEEGEGAEREWSVYHDEIFESDC